MFFLVSLSVGGGGGGDNGGGGLVVVVVKLRCLAAARAARKSQAWRSGASFEDFNSTSLPNKQHHHHNLHPAQYSCSTTALLRIS